MGHTFRFLAEYNNNQEWEISSERWHQLKNILRLLEGDTIEVFDGKGQSAEACITELSKKK